ncbi:MAG: oligogalacturonate lyase family protein [Limisphaerales bacterium]
MKRVFSILLPVVFALILPARAEVTASSPTEWIDPDTGHRVVQLSREPGSQSLYFNLNAFTPDGERMVIGTPTGIATINLKTRAIEKIVDGLVRIIMVGHKTGQVYYLRNGTVCAADLDTKATREVAKLPPNSSISAVNADETLLAGTITGQSGSTTSEENMDTGTNRLLAEPPRGKAKNIEDRFDQHLPMELFFLNIQTGEIRKYDPGNDWLNHLVFSPTDPSLLMFCHEGPWHKVDRIWTIRTDGTRLKSIHQRTMAMEIAGHEFWGADGQTIWYDLQTPRGEDFWVAGYNVPTGQRTRYHLQRDEWSVHFNVSPDGKLFCGDGGDAGMVAHAGNGKWIYLFHPALVPDTAGTNIEATGLIRPGVFKAERLVNMAKHDYALEPNARFSPDGKWVVFRSNMRGSSQVYAVEVKKAGER